ncbi:MAG: glutathione S-transferase N-terminal domain-containing protein [Pseudomonadota bacterium]
MADLSAFPITTQWPPQNAGVIQLYSFPTPNGVKASIALEESGLAYEPHLVNIMSGATTEPPFLSLNPNNKIPAIIDPDGPGGAPFALWESGAILLYLAEKSGRMMPSDPSDRYHAVQWLMWQMGGLGPMAGQMGFFHKFAGAAIEDPRPKERFVSEVTRLLKVLDQALDGRDWLAREFSVADIAIVPWVRTVRDFYEAADLVELNDRKNVLAHIDRFMERPAAVAGMNIPARPE